MVKDLSLHRIDDLFKKTPELFNSQTRIRSYSVPTDRMVGIKSITEGESVGVDLFLMRPIATLNRLGFKTQWSCHGNHTQEHLQGKPGTAYLLFEPAIELPSRFLDAMEELGFALDYCPDMVPGIGLASDRLRIKLTSAKNWSLFGKMFLVERNARFLTALDLLSEAIDGREPTLWRREKEQGIIPYESEGV